MVLVITAVYSVPWLLVLVYYKEVGDYSHMTTPFLTVDLCLKGAAVLVSLALLFIAAYLTKKCGDLCLVRAISFVGPVVG